MYISHSRQSLGKCLLEVFIAGGLEFGEVGQSVVVVCVHAERCGPIAARGPREGALEGREEVEDGEGHQGHVVGDDAPRGDHLAVANTWARWKEGG